jgi:hypothetical protein
MAMAIVGVRPAWKFASPCGYLVRVTDTTDFHLNAVGTAEGILPAAACYGVISNTVPKP